jgi:hypothetical protein
MPVLKRYLRWRFCWRVTSPASAEAGRIGNRPGISTITGADHASEWPSDGYTPLVAHHGTSAMNQATSPNSTVPRATGF